MHPTFSLSSPSLFNALGVNGIVVMVMYGRLCEQTDGGNVITDVSWLQGEEKTCHKGEFRGKGQRHSSCEDDSEGKLHQEFLHKQIFS